jgi:uncharacterized protein
MSQRFLSAVLFLAAACVFTATPAHARDWPKPTGHLNDTANAIAPAYRDSIEALAREVREKTGSQIAVLVVPDLGGEPIDAAAEQVYRQWGIGTRQKDDGVLLLLAVAERRVRIEVGYGLEGILPDGRAGAIIRNVMGPDLRQDRFGPGLLRGTEVVAGLIADEAGVTLERRGMVAAPPLQSGSRSSPAGVLGLILFFLFIMVVVSAIASRRRRTRGWGDWRTRRRRGWYDPWGGFGGGLGGLGGFGGLGGGGGGLGGGGGGFGGFGGGRSGGGGASGGF